MPRKRLYENDAQRQAAYRDRINRRKADVARYRSVIDLASRVAFDRRQKIELDFRDFPPTTEANEVDVLKAVAELLIYKYPFIRPYWWRDEVRP